MDSKPNSDGDVLEAVGLNFVGMIGGSSINCPLVGVVCMKYLMSLYTKARIYEAIIHVRYSASYSWRRKFRINKE